MYNKNIKIHYIITLCIKNIEIIWINKHKLFKEKFLKNKDYLHLSWKVSWKISVTCSNNVLSWKWLLERIEYMLNNWLYK